MKLLTYICENTVSFGVLTENGIVDIGTCCKGPDRPRSVKQVLARGADCQNHLANSRIKGGMGGGIISDARAS